MPNARDDGAHGAHLSQHTLSQRLGAYFLHHRQMLLAGFARLRRNPLATFMTVAVIGIALALPAGTLILVKNARSVSGDWKGAARISLFLKPGLSDVMVQQLATSVREQTGVGAVQMITASQSLADFQQRSGFGDALNLLGSNPLPAVLVVQPTDDYATPAATQQLSKTLGALPQVDQVRMDIQWLERLQAMLDILRRAVIIIGLLLGLAVVFIVGNTIRLEIENRRTEIEVSKLLGATDRFIRRPFLYHGAWYGLAGGVLAWLLVVTALLLMAGPVDRLVSLYGGQFSLRGLGFEGSLWLLVSGIALGWLGSWLAVARHLRDIEPT
jgi:cell division transport system permease protein